MRGFWKLLCSGLLVVMLAGCGVGEDAAAVTAVASPTSAIETAVALPSPAETPAPTAAPSATVPAVTASPIVPTQSPTETAVISRTVHPLAPYTIEGLRGRTYPGGEIEVLLLQEENESYRRYFLQYPSDGLTISGTMNIPRGQGPFPVVILLHGYFDRAEYYTGADTWQAADFLARNGYLTISPDYRGWGSSDSGPSFFHSGLVADVLNLINSLPSLPQADSERVSLLGHSMGGGIATKILTVSDGVAAAVLQAPNSAEDADLIGRWGPGCLPDQSQAEGDKCNPGEAITADLPQEIVKAYLEATGDGEFLRLVAPIHFLEAVNAPVQIHIGEADGENLLHTPPEWSRKLYEALQAEGKEVEFFSYPEEGHYFKSPAWGQFMNHALAFFDEQLKP